MLPSLNHLVQYIQRRICKHADEHCIHSASLLNISNTVDIDYDSISHTLTFAARWSRPPAIFYEPLSGNVTEDAWSLIVDSYSGAEKVEVGVLSNESPTDPSEINLSGFLTVVGQDDRPQPTLFSFPSRHHSLPTAQSKDQEYTLSFLQPTGLHPTMQISFPSAANLEPPANRPADSVCALHSYLTLPSALFADKYQLSTSTTDPLFLHSHHLIALRSISGETDLEAPDYVVQQWGSNLLLELATPTSHPATAARENEPTPPPAWNITIPLHLRYLNPSPSGQTPIEIPYPILFWACTADEGGKFPVNPFDRVNLGYEGLFGSRTMFYHLQPRPPAASGSSPRGAFVVGNGGTHRDVEGRMVLKIQVPVLNLGGSWVTSEWVEWGTVMAVLIGFGWVLWRLWTPLFFNTSPSDGTVRSGHGGKESDKQKHKQKQKQKQEQKRDQDRKDK